MVDRILERVEVPVARRCSTAETLRRRSGGIQIRTRVILESGIGGAYHAVFKGRGMEFAEVREYAPGDEVRTIDWNVTARMGAPYVKKFVEERDLTLLLAGGRLRLAALRLAYLLKRDYAAELAAVLAFSAVANHDRVGAVLFSDRIEGYVPPARGRDHALRIVRDLLAREPAGRGTDLAGALRFAQRVLRRRGIVAVISDFQAEGYEQALGVLRRRHDVVALHLRDPREERRARGRPRGASPTRRRASAWWPTPRGPRCGGRCARPGFEAARHVFKKTRVDALALSHRRVVRAAAARASSRPGRGGGSGASALALAAPRRRPSSLAARGPPAPRRGARRRSRRSPVSVTATASKAEVTVGETFTVELKAIGPAGHDASRFPGEAAERRPSSCGRRPRPRAGAARARAGHPPLRGGGLRPGRGARSRRSPCATACPTAPRARRRRSRSR